MPYTCFVKIRNIRHKGLKRFVEKNDPKGLPASQVEKIRDMITALTVAENLDDLPALPGWRLHPLKANRKDQWSITVTGNRRITFTIRNDEIGDLNWEDYH
ncbi:MAG: type II toxin-antitoxin system RelE/ParE family toxin [Nitrospinales bacterium]